MSFDFDPGTFEQKLEFEYSGWMMMSSLLRVGAINASPTVTDKRLDYSARFEKDYLKASNVGDPQDFHDDGLLQRIGNVRGS